MLYFPGQLRSDFGTLRSRVQIPPSRLSNDAGQDRFLAGPDSRSEALERPTDHKKTTNVAVTRGKRAALKDTFGHPQSPPSRLARTARNAVRNYPHNGLSQPRPVSGWLREGSDDPPSRRAESGRPARRRCSYSDERSSTARRSMLASPSSRAVPSPWRRTSWARS